MVVSAHDATLIGERLGHHGRGRNSIPDVRPCDQYLPGKFADPVEGIGLSGEVSRSWAATMCAQLLGSALHQEFRERDGVAYGAWNTYERVSATRAVIVTAVDILPEWRSKLIGRTRDLLNQLAEDGFEDQRLADLKDMMLRQLQQEGPRPWPWLTAARIMSGDAPRSPEEVLGEIADVAGEAVRQTVLEFKQRLLIGIDAGGMGEAWPLTLTAPRSQAVPAVHTFLPVDYPISRSQIRVGHSHLQVFDEALRGLLVRGNEIAAAIAYADGGRQLIRDDGYQLTVEPSLWRNGSTLLHLVDQLSPDRRVDMPARAHQVIPKPRVTRKQRARYWARRIFYTRWVLVLVSLAMVAFGVVATNINPSHFFPSLLLTIVVLRWLPWHPTAAAAKRRREQRGSRK